MTHFDVHNAPIKNNALGIEKKIIVYVIQTGIVTKFAVFTQEDLEHICSKFRYNSWFYK